MSLLQIPVKIQSKLFMELFTETIKLGYVILGFSVLCKGLQFVDRPWDSLRFAPTLSDIIWPPHDANVYAKTTTKTSCVLQFWKIILQLESVT